jgi:hypothetical protein
MFIIGPAFEIKASIKTICLKNIFVVAFNLSKSWKRRKNVTFTFILNIVKQKLLQCRIFNFKFKLKLNCQKHKSNILIAKYDNEHDLVTTLEQKNLAET